MSNYTKTTDFEAKDSLPTGDSGKIIRGAEFETEFDAISTAIATKADTAGPTFTGTLTFETISDGTIGVTAFVDEDDMSSDSATLVPTQQSVKAYVDSQVTAQDLDFQADTGGALSIDLDSETMTFTGGTGIDTSGSGNAVTFAIDSTVATLTGSQTLTNKTLTSPVLNTGVSGTAVLDEDDMSSNSATQLATQQSIKAYVDSQVGANNELSEILANGNTTGGTNIVFGDSASVSDDRLVFGAGSDLQIYHSGTHSYIDDAGTGNLTLRGNASVRVEKYEGEILADFAADGAVSLYHDNSVKIATTSTGVNVTGTVEFDGLSGTGSVNVTDILDQDDMSSNSATALATQQSIKAYVDSQVATVDTLAEVLGNGNTTGGTDIAVGTGDDVTFADSSKAIFGAGSDLQIYSDGTDGYIDNVTGDFYIRDTTGGTLHLQAKTGEEGIVINDDGSVDLYRNNVLKMSTTSTGIDVTGSVVADGLTVDGTSSLGSLVTITGTAPRIELYETDTTNINGRIDSSGGDLNIKTIADDGGSQQTRIKVDHSTGDISFYEDTGTTAKLFWDASAERLGLGTSSPETNLHIEDSSSFSIIRLVASTTENAGIDFGDPDDRDIGRVRYNNSDNSMVFHTNAAEQMRIDSSGNVIAGHTSALGSAANRGNITINGSSDAILSLGNGGSLKGYILQDSGGMTVYSDGATYQRFYTNGAERMRIDSNGNIGIGTGSPSRQLSIYGTNDGYMSFNGGRAGNHEFVVGTESSGFVIYDETLDTYRLVIDQDSGNVGIGTSSPRYNAEISSSSNTFLQIASTSTSALTGLLFGDTSNAVGRVTYDHSDNSLQLFTNTTEKARIDSSGNVGIGTSSPSQPLHVYHATTNGVATFESGDANVNISLMDSSTTAANYVGIGAVGNNLTFISGNGSERMRIDSSGVVQISNATPTLKFTDTDNNYDATIQGLSGSLVLTADSGAEFGTESIQFKTGAAERARIDSSGNFMVGTTSTSTATQGIKLRSDLDAIAAVADGQVSGYFGRLNSDGDILNFRKDSTTVGTIGSATGGKMFVIGTNQNLQIGANGANVFNVSTTSVYPATDNATDLGFNTSVRWKDLYLSGAANVGGEVVLNDSGTAKFAIGNSTNDFYIYSNAAGSERMRIDSSGKLLVGKTAQNLATEGITIDPNGYIQVTENQSPTLYLNRLTTDGSIINFYKDGTTVGTIGNDSTALTIGSGSTGVKFGTSAVWATTGGSTNANGTKDLGASTVKWKDLYLSGNITLGSTSEINASSALYLDTDIHVFRANNETEKARIDSSGNLLVGKTAANFTVAGHEIKPGGFAGFTRDGGTPIIANRLTSDGDIIEFYKGTTSVGKIGTYSGNLIVAQGSRGLKIQTDRVVPRDHDDTDANGVMDLGDSGNRFKDLYLAGGLYVGGVGSANHLDDYEEGTFTPVLQTSNTDINVTYTVQDGSYTKIGNVVTIQIFIQLSAVTSQGTGTLKLTGFPFANTTYQEARFATWNTAALEGSGDQNKYAIRINGTEGIITTSSAGTLVNTGNVSTSYLILNGSYKVA